jgi:hypothetical protein
MSQRNPASILLDVDGNLVGVIQDGTVYRLQVEATVVNSEGSAADIEVMGTREALAVSYPELLSFVSRIEQSLERINAQLATITGNEDPL